MNGLDMRRHCHALLFLLAVLIANDRAAAADNAQLLSVTVTNGTVLPPRTVFTQTWTMTNTGTTTWTPTFSGYTMNIVGTDSLGAVPPAAKTYASHTLSTYIGSGASIPPGGKATFTMSFITPETPGPVTDVFQLNNSSSVYFGPTNTLQIVVAQAGSTNQYDRARGCAASYARFNRSVVTCV